MLCLEGVTTEGESEGEERLTRMPDVARSRRGAVGDSESEREDRLMRTKNDARSGRDSYLR